MIALPALLLFSATLAELLQQHQTQPESVALCEQIGVLYLQRQELEPAAEYFRQALQLKPDLLAARKNLATTLWFLSQHAASEHEFQKVLLAAPHDPVANLYTGLAAYERKDYLLASSRLQAAGDLASANPEVRPIFMECLLRAGSVMDKQGAPAKAYETYRTALRMFPDTEEVYLSLSEFAIAHGNSEYAGRVASDGLTKLPHSSKLLFQRGIASAVEGRFNEADLSFSEAARADAAWASPHLALGVSNLQTGDARSAAEQFDEAARLSPADWRPLYLYALAAHKSGDAAMRERAMRDLGRAVQLAPKEAMPHTLLGQMLLAAGRREEAGQQLDIAHRLAPADATTLYRLALLCRQQGKAEEAARLMRAFEEAKEKSHSEQVELLRILKTSSRDAER